MYYIYIARIDSKIVYIGKGTGDRYLHLNSGTSHIYEANQHHFSGGQPVEIEFIMCPDEESALDRESKLIREFCPAWNKMHTGKPMIRRKGIKTSKNKNSTSDYYGVGYSSRSRKNPWRAFYTENRVKHHIGNYPDEVSAAIARDEYVLDNNLEQRLNFSTEGRTAEVEAVAMAIYNVYSFDWEVKMHCEVCDAPLWGGADFDEDYEYDHDSYDNGEEHY